MLKAVYNGYSGELETYGEQIFAETPFTDPGALEREQEESVREASFGETLTSTWEFTTPFLPGESVGLGETGGAAEISEFSEITAELKDSLFREALEQLADEALEANEVQLAGEYGDRETRDMESERLLNQHFEPLVAQAESILTQFFERLETYEAESLTDSEIERISNEVLPTGTQMTPESEQFLGGLLRKASRLVSGAVKLAKKGVEGAVKLAGKGLSYIGKLALGPVLKGLKLLARYLLNHVIKFALGHLPPPLRPLAQKLSERLFQALGETQEAEMEDHEQTEAEVLPATYDAARLEAEFDVHAAQLLFTPDEAEADHLVTSYGEAAGYLSPLPALDNARVQMVKGLSLLQPGESAQPIMEQFIPAFIWPAAKTAITLLGRDKVVDMLGKLLSGLVKPLIGADASALLSPAIADVGFRIFGLETGSLEPRTMLAEALAATVEETVHSVSELPSYVLENETLLSDAVHEAFENAAASYFPNSVIKPELRESGERHGMWARMPARSGRKRYAKYSDTLPVEIPLRLTRNIQTFGGATLNDHLQHQHGLPDNRPFKGNVTLYQALPGTRGSTIARAEGFPPSQLHPLTPQAAAVLLGQNAALGIRPTPGTYLSTPQRLHVNQRLYRIEPPPGRSRHVRRIHSEMLINLLRGEIRIWLYVNEPLCQMISSELAKGNRPTVAFKKLKSLMARTAEMFKLAMAHRHLPPEIMVVSETPNLDGRVQHWLRYAGRHLAAKISEWTQVQMAQYLRNSAEEFRRLCASHHDGVTLRITMTRVPGMDALRQLSKGRIPKDIMTQWPTGSPAFQVIARPGYAMNRLED